MMGARAAALRLLFLFLVALAVGCGGTPASDSASAGDEPEAARSAAADTGATGPQPRGSSSQYGGGDLDCADFATQEEAQAQRRRTGAPHRPLPPTFGFVPAKKVAHVPRASCRRAAVPPASSASRSA